MSGRGNRQGPRGQARGAGRGRSSPEAQAKAEKEPKFRGSNAELPSLNFGASAKENKPIDFMQTMGEHVAINYKPSICHAFWSTPPEYGEEDEEPPMPEEIPAGNVGKAILSEYQNDHKDWKSDAKKIKEQKSAVFALVYSQLSESSRGEVQDDEDWPDAFLRRDLLFLISRIRATHIARQSGNPGQDRERVQTTWASLRMFQHETSFAFRKRVEDHQLERLAVGLAVIPEEELVVGILNRLDMSRYAQLARDYFDNERRGIADLPAASATLWREVKDAQIIRFRGTGGGNLESVYYSQADDKVEGGKGQARGGRGGRNGRGGRGNRDGRGGRTPRDSGSPSELKTAGTMVQGPVTSNEIVCWNCHKKGHRASACTVKSVHFTDAIDEDETIFYSSVETCSRDMEITLEGRVSNVFLSNVTKDQDTTILLDTQSSIHIFRNRSIVSEMHTADNLIIVQGITGDRVKVHMAATVTDIGLKCYFSPHMSANIISYHKLLETHVIQYNSHTDTFSAVPTNGPTLTFNCVNGHYVLDLATVTHAYAITVNPKAFKYSAKQRADSRLAYEFIQRMGYISYKAAAEIIQRGSMKDIPFTRSDLVIAQDIYGTPAAYQLGQGTHLKTKTRSDDRIPLHESVAQELQVDLFYFLGQTFFLSISVILGLIMVTHLGPGIERSIGSHNEKSRSLAGKALLLHIQQYLSKGFRITTVTSDGEGAVKTVRRDVENLGIDLNILGHGSHAPHAEAAIRHVKNKARSTLHSLPFPLPSKLTAALIAFVVHLSNMVPKANSPGHTPAYTSFRGRVPNYKLDAPYPFGTAGFLQKAPGPLTNTAAARADYCLWLGTTRNQKGTHRCLSLATLREVTGDTFREAPLTEDAIKILKTMASNPLPAPVVTEEPPLLNPDTRYPLDPNRGVDDVQDTEEETIMPEVTQMTLVPAETTSDSDLIPLEEASTLPLSIPVEVDQDVSQENNVGENGNSLVTIEDAIEDTQQSDEDTLARNTFNNGYNLRKTTTDQHVYATLSIKEAKRLYGDEVADAAIVEEIQNCIKKDVFEFQHRDYKTRSQIPSKMFLTPKKLPNGNIDRMKARLVAGGHRQDRSLYTDQETSSPTVALSSVLMTAALAADRGYHIMTLDHKAAYLNATMVGHVVEMSIGKEVASLLCRVSPRHAKYVRADGSIIVRLRKALYGCIESAVLWYKELSGTLEDLGFKKNPYDECSFVRHKTGRTDTILVYVDDLMLTSKSKDTLVSIANALKKKYKEVTLKEGTEHDFLGIHWDFTARREVVLSMKGYVNNILEKYAVSKKAKTPATEMLFQTNSECEKLGDVKRQWFHSCVMELHYLAKRIRGDILTAVSYCATRVLGPDKDDEAKLDRILGYLLATQHKTLTLRIGPDTTVRAYVDASFGTYDDMRSVTGVVVMIGNATVYVKSAKQKIVTRSSTESELVALSDALSQILWTREYIIHQGVQVGPAIVYQDNKSTICLVNKGKSTSERTRHIKNRYFFITSYIEANEIKVEYLPTGEMVADILTKPLHGALFGKFTGLLMG